MTKKPKEGTYRFVYEIELPATADTNAFLERLQVLVGKYNGFAGGGMIGAPNPTVRYRVLDSINVERDAPDLREADVVSMTEGRRLLGIPSQSGMATYVRLKHAPIVIDLSEPNPQRRNRLLRKWVKAEMRSRKQKATKSLP